MPTLVAMRRLRPWLIALALVAGAVLAYVQFSGFDEITIFSASAVEDGRVLVLGLESCNADHRWTIEETPERVTVTVWDDDAPLVRTSGDDCLDALDVELAAPIGERTLVDGSSGEVVSVEPPDG